MMYKICFVAVFSAVSYLALHFSGLTDRGSRLRFAVIPACVIVFTLRALVLDYKTLDYLDFLSRWVDYFRMNGGFRALREPVGNYNIPYQYLLAAISYTGFSDLYQIKAFSVFFDLVAAWSGAMIVKDVSENRRKGLICFFTVLALPTVFLNGALWGQCDSVYAGMALLGIWLALSGRPVPAMAAIALSFGFKLQAVFVMPVFAVLWAKGYFRWYHFAVFPAVYLLMTVPALIAGSPFADTVMIYFNQTGSIGSGLNYNSPSLFALFDGYFLPQIADTASASKYGIATAFVFTLCVIGMGCFGPGRTDRKNIVLAAALLAAGIPFLLPHMHDRYFFCADVLTMILAFMAPEYIPAAICTQFASLLGYHAYLKMRYLLPMSRGTIALFICLIILFTGYVLSCAGRRRENADIHTE